MDRTSTQWRGSLTEIKSSAKLMELGYRVSKPLDESSPYDVIMDDGQTLSRVQIKSASLQDGYVSARIHKFHNITRVRTKYTKADVDYFLIYCAALDDYFLVPFSDDLGFDIRLRISSKSKQNKKMRWAEDYRI